jgi:hypothetical protein
MRYEWDGRKNLVNQRKHDGISFEVAAQVFDDPDCLILPDRVDQTGEQRWHALGAVLVEPRAARPDRRAGVQGELRWGREYPYPLGAKSW